MAYSLPVCVCVCARSPLDFACHLPVPRDSVGGSHSASPAIAIETLRFFRCSPACLQIHFRQFSNPVLPATARQSILPPTSIEYCKILLLLLLPLHIHQIQHPVSIRQKKNATFSLPLAVSKRQPPRFQLFPLSSFLFPRSSFLFPLSSFLFPQFHTALRRNRPLNQSGKLSYIRYPDSRPPREFACKYGLSSCQAASLFNVNLSWERSGS